jgi:hypothetical protein
MAATLTLHAGGASPAAVALKTEEAARALSELAAVVPPGDALKDATELLGLALAGRCVGAFREPGP